ncbi:MAG: hypothetical protein HQK79_20155 [Desulfobacterales bacterium]|nr:hypothetical protein [Desulfobacterales bacterium]
MKNKIFSLTVIIFLIYKQAIGAVSGINYPGYSAKQYALYTDLKDGSYLLYNSNSIVYKDKIECSGQDSNLDYKSILDYKNEIALGFKKNNIFAFIAYYKPFDMSDAKYDNGMPGYLAISNTYIKSITGLDKYFTKSEVQGGWQNAYGIVGGISYKISAPLSAFAGLRYIYARQTSEIKSFDIFGGNDRLYVDLEADGYSYLAGVNWKASKTLDIGIGYESNMKFEYYYNQLIDPRPKELKFVDHVKRQDIPAKIATGLKYKLFDDINIEAALTYYFYKDAYLLGVNNEDYNNFSNTYSISTLLNWHLKALDINLGLDYFKSPSSDEMLLDYSHILDKYTCMFGVHLPITPSLSINTNLFYTIFVPESTVHEFYKGYPVAESFDSQMTKLSFGFIWKIL